MCTDVFINLCAAEFSDLINQVRVIHICVIDDGRVKSLNLIRSYKTIKENVKYLLHNKIIHSSFYIKLKLWIIKKSGHIKKVTITHIRLFQANLVIKFLYYLHISFDPPGYNGVMILCLKSEGRSNFWSQVVFLEYTTKIFKTIRLRRAISSLFK